LALQGGQQCGTEATKPGIRRNVIEDDLSGLGDAAHREDLAILDCDKQCIARSDPRFDNLGCLVAQPSFENDRVIPVFDETKLRYGSLPNLAGG